MLLTTPLVALLSVLPFLASAKPEPEYGLSIKKVDMARKRQTGGNYVSDYGQCTQVCDGYFGKPTSTLAANNAAVVTTSRASSSTRPVSTTTRPASSAPPTSSRPASSAAATTTRPASSAAPTSSRPASSAAISSATSTRPVTSQAAATGASSVGGANAAQQKLLLDLHNAERKDYGANPLTWNTELEQYALTYAKKCLWKHSGGPYGENLAASYGSEPVSTGVNGWNAERSDYNPASPMYSHWTQVVWKATSQVGCAVVKCPAGTIQPGWPETDSIVCEYRSPGNYAGQYGTNVGTRVA